MKKSWSPGSSDDDEPLSKLINGEKRPPNADDSSSDSDIENYLQRPDRIDLNSPFFSLEKAGPSQDDTMGAASRLTDSESEDEMPLPQAESAEPSLSKLNFSQLHEYTKKIEETRRHVEEYNARKKAREKETDIENLLAAGEAKITDELKDLEEILHSSDFESCSDSEKEGWEEVEGNKKENNGIPKEGLQITVAMPDAVKKKKGVDLLMAIKRRINRVRKENQILIHKVHLLCWIAHGNYLSSRINSETVLAVALSLLPSQQSYPPDRTDLKYLEQILKWYRNTVTNAEKPVPTNKPLGELLESQITNKQALNKKMWVYIFVAIIRCLGIQCRLVLSFQTEPLRPPNNELHSLSTKTDTESKKNEQPRSRQNIKVPKEAKSRSKSTSDALKAEASTSKSKTCNSNEKNVSKLTASASKDKAISSCKEKVKPTSKEKIMSGSEEKVIDTPKKKIMSTSKSSKSSASGGKDPPRSKTSNSKDRSAPKPKEGLKLKIPSKTKETVGSKSATTERLKTEKESEKPKPRNISRLKTTKSTSDVPPKEKKVSTASQIKIKLKDTKEEAPKRRLRSQKEPTIPQLDGAGDTRTPPKPNLRKLKQKEAPCPIKTHPKRLKTMIKYRDSDSEDDFATTRSPFTNRNKDSPHTNGPNLRKLRNYVPKSDVRKDIVQLVKKSIKEQKDLDQMKKVNKKRSVSVSGDDSDYVPAVVKKKHRESEDDFTPKVKVKRRVQVKQDEEEQVKKKQGMDVWAEVFLEAEEKWISVDVVRGQVHCVNELYTRATHPVSYIVAWNNDNTLKDITKRYCNNFNTVTRKLRTDAQWWTASLKPFTGRKTARDTEEDDELERQQLEKPLPTSIAEYKNHPLYVLKRHLLKFEALYPPDPPTLGFVRNEPVYSRQCVYVLHSRDIWLKHAKVVKLGEQPYKIVKARPRWDKLSSKIVTDQLLEIFGPWQVEDYVPPTAENGVVPRNAFGNVELFKTKMLPKGTVHLQLPGLNKIARRMNIDCAPALVGFDFHGGWSHPTYDGYVVCEEFTDQLVAAWEIEQDEIVKREQEKIDKRVYGNWKRLIRGLLIRERLKLKYEFGESSGSGGGAGKNKAKTPKLVTKKRKVEAGSDTD